MYDAVTVGQLRAALADLDPNDLVYSTTTTEFGGTRIAYLRQVDQAIGEVELRFGDTAQDRLVSFDDTVTELELQDARAELEAAGELAPVTELRRPRGSRSPRH